MYSSSTNAFGDFGGWGGKNVAITRGRADRHDSWLKLRAEGMVARRSYATSIMLRSEAIAILDRHLGHGFHLSQRSEEWSRE